VVWETAVRSTSSDLGGIVSMLSATAILIVGDAFVKLVTADLPPFEVLFWRSTAASMACAVLVTWRGEWREISGMWNPRALTRALGETACTLCYIVALVRMPIADVVAILQTTPLLVILGAALILRERIGPGRIFLALVGFVGALMVAQPGSAGFSIAALLAFAAAGFGAVRDLAGRTVPKEVPIMVVNLATMAMMIVASGVLSIALEDWVAPSARHLTFLGFAGLFLALGHIGLLLAYRLGRAGAVAPFFYCLALWAVIVGFLVWGDLPNTLALAGIGLIVASGIAIVSLTERRA
jgi:drug/metabolite transporter (DMT)-like permease